MSSPQVPSGSQQRTPRRPGTFKVATFTGIDVLVSSSWFLIAALIAVVVAPRIEQVQPDLGVWKYAVGVVFAVVLYLSLLLHEGSHAVAAKRYGFPVESITLHFFGGMTAIRGESRSPRQEFVIAVVGPLTSIGVGLAALGLWFVTPDGLLRLIIEGLAGANLIVGTINLVPGLPLDGGRLLKSAVWRATGQVHTGTIAAGWGGRTAAVAVLFWPLVHERVLGRPPQVLDYALCLATGFFLWMAATQAISSARIRQRLPRLIARDLARHTLSVPDDLPLAEAVRRAQQAEAGSLITTTSSGEPVGLVSEAALMATPEARRPWIPVSTVARSLEEGLRLPASITGEELVLAISRVPAEEYLLVEPDGSIVGVLATADVDRAFRDG